MNGRTLQLPLLPQITFIIIIGFAITGQLASAASRSVEGAWISTTSVGSVLHCFYDGDHFYTEITKAGGARAFSGYGTYTLKDNVIEYRYTTSDSKMVRRGSVDRETVVEWHLGSFEVPTDHGPIHYREIGQQGATPVPDKLANVRVYDLGELTRGPKCTKKEHPRYPFEQQRSHIEGIAVIECVIDSTGTISNMRCIAASHPAFAREALVTMKAWQFTPGFLGKTAVATRLIQTMSFH